MRTVRRVAALALALGTLLSAMCAHAAPVQASCPTPAVSAYGASVVPQAAGSATPSGAPSTGPHPPGTAGARPATPLRLLVLIALLGGTFLLARRARRSN